MATTGMNRSDEVGVRLTRTVFRRIQSMNISWKNVSVVLVTFVVFLMRNGAAEASPAESNFTQGLMYLAKYGYFPPTVSNPKAGSLIEGGVFRDAVKKFQEFAQIPATGELDADTIDLMKLPRCGVTDNVGFGNAAKKRRRKRYTLQGSRWRVKTLTYQITKYPTKLSKSNVDAEVARAFKVWSDVTDLSFSPVSSGKIHIEIRFEMGEHGDGDPFDGPGGTLAHAYFPIYGGDAHFDDSETWTISKSSGTDLFQVAAHEFGHSLGLGHSDIRQALMAPFYRGYDANFKLHSDDVTAIQALYGKKSSDTENTVVTSPTKAPTPTKGPDAEGSASGPQLCQNSKIDTLLTTKDGTTYAFRGEYYWKLTDAGVASGFPKKITDDWPDLPTNLDAAFSWINGKIYFFKGSQYWRYTEKSLDSGYPKLIKKGFEGIPDNIDSAFVWSGNGKIYFFKADKYWRFNPDARPPVSESYPKEIKNWQGLPTTGNLDAALQYSNKMTYFFKDGQYWRFNDNDFEVDKADPPYPRPAGDWWFGCNGVKSGSLHVETIARRFNGRSPNPDSVLDADDTKKRRDTAAFEGANSSQKSNQPVSIQFLFVFSCISYLLTTVTAANFWNTR